MRLKSLMDRLVGKIPLQDRCGLMVNFEHGVSWVKQETFCHFLKLAELVLTLPNSNAEKERLFSVVRKNKTKQQVFNETL